MQKWIDSIINKGKALLYREGSCDKTIHNDCKVLNSLHEYILTITDEAKKYNNGWIPVAGRKPTSEEYSENDGRFLVYDGISVYESCFDVIKNEFRSRSSHTVIHYWQSLPNKPQDATRYFCTEDLWLPLYDENESMTDDFLRVPAGSIWAHKHNNISSSDCRLEYLAGTACAFGYIDVSIATLSNYFRTIQH